MEKHLDDFYSMFASTNSYELSIEEAVSMDDAQRSMLATALFEGFITVVFGKIKNIYTLTEKGIALVEGIKIKQQAKAVVDVIDENVEGDDEFYPLLFRNKRTGSIVLAINNTSGTIVKVADAVDEGEYPLPLGTFQTCFIPFYATDVWERMGGVTIDLTGKGE